MTSFDRFLFEDYDYAPETGVILLRYALEAGPADKPDERVVFEEKLRIDTGFLEPHERIPLDAELLDRALFNLHLIGGISYYKAACPREMVIKSGSLCREEADFWNKLYVLGLGEFFYRNGIKDFNERVNFPYEEGKTAKAWPCELPERSLLPLGGGKDSIVAAELMMSQGMDFELFNMGAYMPARDAADVMDKTPLLVDRDLSPELFRLNAEGALNGHIPISAYIAFLSALLGLLYGFRYIVLGNERSANEGNAQMQSADGKEALEVNHQYSKSFEFEQDVNRYLKTFLCPQLEYFSLLRPYYEIKITQLFAAHPEHFSTFTSCNRNFKAQKNGERPLNLWCGRCAKCAFVFAMLAPFVEKAKLLTFFGKNMLSDNDLWPLYAELLGLTPVKPFDCVGTPEEVEAALWMAREAYAGDAVMKAFLEQLEGEPSHPELMAFYNEHLIPETFTKLLIHLKKRVLLLGFGKENRSVYRFVHKHFPEWTIGIADKNEALTVPEGVVDVHLGTEYMEVLGDYDIIVKTPGIPWVDEVEDHVSRITSATQLFFDNLHNSNMVIGVTGSKGKSTTATLIYKVLKAARKAAGDEGREVYLVGNIGSPALDYLGKRDCIFVYELSSYQLDQTVIRPDVAVFTSFFPDHLDYHGNLEFYLGAKANITAHQKEEDVFIYHAKDKDLARIDTAAQRFVVKDFKPVKTKLRGHHNQENIALVKAVADIFKVDEALFKKVVADFDGLSHRLETVGTFKGITFVDDANATTPQGTLAALKAFDGQVGCIFLGGTDRGYDFRELAAELARQNVPNVVLFPDTGKSIAEAFPEDYQPLTFETDSMEAAVQFAYAHTPEGSTCLLSMASPSYSLFKGFEAKGEAFQRAVQKGS